VNSRESRAGRR